MGEVRLAPHRDPEPGRQDRSVEVLDQGSPPRRRLTAGSSPDSSSLHRFCQFDFPFAPGPADGRYLVRGSGGDADVIVVKTLGAELKRAGLARRSLGRRRGPRPAEGESPEPVSVTRVTVIRGTTFDDGAAAREWLAGCRDRETAEGEVGAAMRLLNRAIQAHRVSAADPYAADVSRGRARRVRIGYGSGDELVEGRSREAFELPADIGGRSRRRMLAPEEQVALILGGRRSTHPSEELLLRARLDLEQGRTREAALQARAAQATLVAELTGEGTAEARATAERHAQLLDEVALAALERELDSEQVAKLGDAVVEMERLIRRRRHAGGADGTA